MLNVLSTFQIQKISYKNPGFWHVLMLEIQACVSSWQLAGDQQPSLHMAYVSSALQKSLYLLLRSLRS